MSSLLLPLVALAGIFMFGMLVAVFRRWPMLVLYAAGLLALAAWDFPATPGVSLGGTQIKGEDMIVLAAVAATALRPQQILKVTRRHNLLMALLVLCLAFSLAVGFFRFETAAINEFRGFFWPIGISAWMLNQDWQSETMQASLHKWATLTGLGLSIVFLIHAGVYGLGTADTFVIRADGTEQTGRPLVSGQALLLALTGLIQFRRSVTKGRGGYAWLGVAFMVMAVMCQHRSVWLAVAIALAMVLVRLRGVALARTVMGTFYGGVLVFALYVAGGLDGLINGLIYSVNSTGTYSARVDTWTSLIDDSIERGPFSVIFGEAFGFGYDRIDNGRLLTFAPHNWYVSVYLRLGLVGLAVFALVLLSTLSRLTRIPGAVVPTIVLLSIVVYQWSYSLPWYLAPMLGWCIALAWSQAPKVQRAKRRKQHRLPDAYKHLAPRQAADTAPSLRSSGRREVPTPGGH